MIKKKQTAWLVMLTFCVYAIFSSFGAIFALAANADYFINIDEGDAYNGTVKISAAGGNIGDVLTLKAGGSSVSLSNEAPLFTVNYTTIANTDSTYNAKNRIVLNGNPLSDDAGISGIPFASDGDKGVTFPLSRLNKGKNTLYIIIGIIYGGAMGKPYNPTLPHGISTQGNNDDFTVQNLRLTLPGGTEPTINTVTTYKPTEAGVAAAVSNVKQTTPYNPATEYWLGDGWPGADSYANNSNPRLDIPFALEFTFDYQGFAAVAEGLFNTSEFADGEQKVELFANGAKVLERNVIVDNGVPIINANIQNGMTYPRGMSLKADFIDGVSGIKTKYSELNGEEIELPYLLDLPSGFYYLNLYAEDLAGNKTYKFISFNIASRIDLAYGEVSLSGQSFSLSKNGIEEYSATAYSAERLDISYGYGVNFDNTKKNFTNFGNYDDFSSFNMGTGEAAVQHNTSLGNPYQSFEVDVSGLPAQSNVFLTYDGGTRDGEYFTIKGFNTLRKEWVEVAEGYGTQKVSFVMNTAQYASENKIRFVVTMKLLDENRNRMLWLTDTQHLTKFSDLNELFYGATKYALDEYEAGRSAYFMNTGDLVEDSLVSAADAEIRAQWEVAEKAYKPLYDKNIPYGVVSGNHDTGSNVYQLDYSYYTDKFGAEMFAKNYWYGTMDDNRSHYDLVTVGGYDFIFLYLGYGIEATPETVAWSNYILQKYSHRNAVILTHTFLRPDGTIDPFSRAQDMVDKIIEPNDNVKMVFCGHHNGAATASLDMGAGRKVEVVLQDYQFVETQSYPNDHIIGSTPNCNGEGWMREIIIGNNSVKMSTLNPNFSYTDTPFGENDNVDVTVNFNEMQRYISTNAVSAVVIGSELALTETADTYNATAENGKSVIVKLSYSEQNYIFTFVPNNNPGTAPLPTSPINTDFAEFSSYLNRLKLLKLEMYTLDTRTNMSLAITEAEKVTSSTSGSQLRNIYAILYEAENNLEIKSIDRSILQDTVDEYKSLYVEDKYTSESWAVYSSALTAAETILAADISNIEQEDVDNALSELIDAAEKLVENSKGCNKGCKSTIFGSGNSTVLALGLLFFVLLIIILKKKEKRNV